MPLVNLGLAVLASDGAGDLPDLIDAPSTPASTHAAFSIGGRGYGFGD